MEKIKVLHLITDLEPGGAQLLLLRTSRGIDSERFEFYVAFMLGKGTLSAEFQSCGIKVLDLTRGKKFSWISPFKLFMVLRKYKIDILHTHLVHASLLGRVVGRMAGVSAVISTRHFGYDPKVKSLIYYLERKSGFLDKRIIAVSAAVKKYFSCTNPAIENRICVIYNGLDIDSETQRDLCGELMPEFRILSAGRLHKIKRFDILIRAAAIIKEQNKDFRVLIAGDGPERHYLQTLIRELNLQDNVYLAGQKTNSEIIGLIKNSDLYVQSSDWEAFGLSILEAMSQSLAVVATNVGGIPEIIKNGYDGILVSPSDPQELAVTILRLLKNRRLRKLLGENARKRVEQNFILKQSVAKQQELYQELWGKSEHKRPVSNAKHRILQIITRLNIGGAARHVIILSSNLNDHRFDCQLVTGKERKSEGNMRHLARNMKMIDIPELQREISIIRDIKAFWKIYRHIRKYKPHIVHTHTSKAGVLGRIAAKMAGTPITIHTFHGHIFGDFFSPLKTKLFLFIERLMSRFTTRIISISELIHNDLINLRIINGNGRIIENGFDLNQFVNVGRSVGNFRQDLGLEPEDILVGTVARLVPTKGCSYLLDAAPSFLDLSPSIRLVIVGDGELKDELQRQVRSLGIERKVIFTGFREDMLEVYSAFDILVLPSLREGLPTVIIEALCCGLPVVATNVDAVPDLVTPEMGILVEPKNSEALAEAVREAVKRLPWRLDDRIRQHFSRRFGTERLVQDMKRLYDELAHRKP